METGETGDGEKEKGRDGKKEDEKERQIKESLSVEEATWDSIILWICPSLQFIEEIKFQVRKCEKNNKFCGINFTC